MRGILKAICGKPVSHSTREARRASERATENMHAEIKKHREVARKIICDDSIDVVAVMLEDMRRGDRPESVKV